MPPPGCLDSAKKANPAASQRISAKKWMNSLIKTSPRGLAPDLIDPVRAVFTQAADGFGLGQSIVTTF